MHLWILLTLLLTNTEPASEEMFQANLPEVTITAKYPTAPEAVLLAKLLNAECPYEPLQGQIGVATVVANRMAYKYNYPRENIRLLSSYTRFDHLSAVVYAKGQFDGIHSKRFHSHTREQYVIAYKVLLLNQYNLPSNVLFFHNKTTSTDKRWVAKLSKYELHTPGYGKHTFCSKL